MKEKVKKYLSDILLAIELIQDFTTALKGFTNYREDLKTKSAVERQLGIIGEAVNQAIKENPKIALSNARQMIDFRNRLIHSYDNLDDSIVWVILKKHIPILKTEVEKLLEDS